MTDQERQELLDSEHLRLLWLGYLISGGANAVMALVPLIHITLGLFMIFGAFPGAPGPSNKAETLIPGLFFVVIGGALSTIFAIVATLKLLTARRLRERRSKTFCIVTAGISCFGLPYGTALGVFTLLVLSRPSVQALFSEAASSPAPAG